VTFTVLVDWSRNGTFTDTGDDVTTVVRGALSAQYGRDQATALSPIVAGRGAFTLDNSSRDYSPRNTSSPLFGKVKPSRPVLVQRTISGTTYTVFRGHTDDSPIDPDVNAKTVGFSLMDYLADFRGVNVTTPLYQGIRTGAAIDAVLTAAGWTGGRVLDTGGTLIPWWWCNGDDASDMLQQLLASEGPPALLTIDETGAVVFRDRHHRITSTASTTSQATFGTAEPAIGGFRSSEPWANIINDVSISVDERTLSPTGIPVWETEEVISIAASQSYTVVISTSDPFTRAIVPSDIPPTPNSTVDYVVLAGSVASVSLSATSGASTSITITAGASGATIQGMRLRAYSLTVARSRVTAASDATSKTAYGVRTLPSDLEPKWASYPDAQDLAALFVATRKDPLTQVQTVFTCHDSQTARLTAVLARDLSDRVTVVEAETVTNGPFYVESISHDAPSFVEHVVTFGLEAVPTAAAAAAAFILGTSTLNGATPIGY
jgi:hypothetical protein